MEDDINYQLQQMQTANMKSKWSCTKCTFINGKYYTNCTICGTPYHQEKHDQEQWNDITLIDFMPTIKLSKNYAAKMQSKQDDALLQIATQLSLESHINATNKRNYNEYYDKFDDDKNKQKTFEKILSEMNNEEYGHLSNYSKKLFYKYDFLQSLILPKLKIINKNASDNYSKINIEFIVKEMVIKRLNFMFDCNEFKTNTMKLIYVNAKNLPLLNSMKANVLFNGKTNQYHKFCNDSLVKLSGMNVLIFGYLKCGKNTFIPTDIVNLIHLFCNLNPEQLLYKMDANTNISYFKKRAAKIKIVSTTTNAMKMLHYNRTNATNKIYLCLLFNANKPKKNILDDRVIYSDILPLLSISKQVKAFKYYGSNNYEAWFIKRSRQSYPSYWNAEYANLFYQVEYQEYYGHI